MISREQLIKFIPKPKNEEVIVYDSSLLDLVNENVIEKYYKLYDIFVKSAKEYKELKEKKEVFEHEINNMYLYNPSWDEKDYLDMLKNIKTTYNTLYNDINKIESNISLTQKKIEALNEKIHIQEEKESNKLLKDKDNANEEISKSKDKILNYRSKINELNQDMDFIDEQIKDNEDTFNDYIKMVDELDTGKCHCLYCGHTITSTGPESNIYKKLTNNIERNKYKLDKLLSRKKQIETNIAYYESEMSKVKAILNNNMSLLKGDNNLYRKKSLEVLKLEASRDEMVNYMSKLKKELSDKPQLATGKYKGMKERISQYELSLQNLNKIKELKAEFETNMDKFQTASETLKTQQETINKYIKFISLFYRIYEQKADFYFGNDFKFKFAKFENYKLCEVFEIYYKGTEYDNLSLKDKNTVSDIFIEKIGIFD